MNHGEQLQAAAACRDAPTPSPAAFFNPVAVELPEKLDFRDPHDWRRWIAQWERYRIISGLNLRDQVAQVNTFINAMGREAEDAQYSLRLTDVAMGDCDTVKSEFENHFVPHHNIVYQRAKFNMREQEAHETAEMFITDLHKLADTCEYGNLQDDLIRDRMVVGLLDKKLCEKLQLDSKLMLQGATLAARNSETVRRRNPNFVAKRTHK